MVYWFINWKSEIIPDYLVIDWVIDWLMMIGPMWSAVVRCEWQDGSAWQQLRPVIEHI